MKGIDFEVWFGRAMWLGILADWLLGIRDIFWPNATLALAGQTPDLEHPVWPAFASLLLVLLSLFYIPARSSCPYRATAILSAWRGRRRPLLPLALAQSLSGVWIPRAVAHHHRAPLLVLALKQQSKFNM